MKSLLSFEKKHGLALNSKTALFSNVPITNDDKKLYPFLSQV